MKIALIQNYPPSDIDNVERTRYLLKQRRVREQEVQGGQ